ncbi:MAG: tetratricopeptide repeat protein [Methylocystis sp.]
MAALPAPQAIAEEWGPPSIESFRQDGENFLFIPGIGRIPLPPGSRALGPGRGGGELAPQRRTPAAGPPPQPKDPVERRAEEMERLYLRLEQAEDEREAKGVAASIVSRWSRSESDTTNLLAARAIAADAAGAPSLAMRLIDYVVALSPQWPEAYALRAKMRAAQGDDNGAIADLETAATLEPKRFDALAALGALKEKSGDKKGALAAYRKSLAISPQQESLRKIEERLHIEVEGRDI